jgi:hypothetical protein
MHVKYHDSVDPEFAAAPSNFEMAIDGRLPATLMASREFRKIKRWDVRYLGCERELAHE